MKPVCLIVLLVATAGATRARISELANLASMARVDNGDNETGELDELDNETGEPPWGLNLGPFSLNTSRGFKVNPEFKLGVQAGNTDLSAGVDLRNGLQVGATAKVLGAGLRAGIGTKNIGAETFYLPEEAIPIIPEVSSECEPFYNALAEACQARPPFHLNPFWYDCKNYVPALWRGGQAGLESSTFHWLLANQGLPAMNTAERFRSASSSLLPVTTFWCGFSVGLGTRKILDRILVALSTSNDFEKVRRGLKLSFEDIEHPSHLLGKILRNFKISWARACHRTKSDRQLFLGLSRAYAQEAKRARMETYRAVTAKFKREQFQNIQRVGIWLIINYGMKDFEKSFLYEHELPLLSKYPDIHIVDFKNSCSKELLEKIRDRLGNAPANIPACYHDLPVLREFGAMIAKAEKH